MNRPGGVPQTMRGMPGNFGGQQQPQQSGRSVSSRLPNGKMGNTGSGWAFGGNVPMGTAGLQNVGRQMGGNVSFAQSLSGSQPATPLDLSEFPSLSNNSQLSSGNQGSMWSTGNGANRNISGPVQRNQGTPVSQGVGHEDLFSQGQSRMPSAPGSFRFGGQSNIQSSGQTPSGGVDEFPPLNRSGNGDVSSERGQSLMSSLGLGGHPDGTENNEPGNRGNGLLNALSANSRTGEARTGPEDRDSKSSNADEAHQKSLSSFHNGMSPMGGDAESRTPLGGMNNDTAPGNPRADPDSQPPDAVDPLAGMAEVDKWGIKGLRTLMNNYPDYHAMIVGMDPGSLGLDLGSPDMISTQSYSVFDDAPPRPTTVSQKFRLPDCYNVTNVQPIESKIPSFNEDTLFWIFYSSPLDLKQQLAAAELHGRNWRWHKKLHVWLTKDEHMAQQMLSPSHERGWYVVWDTSVWRKERRELTLHYSDLDTSLGQAPVGT